MSHTNGQWKFKQGENNDFCSPYEIVVVTESGEHSIAMIWSVEPSNSDEVAIGGHDSDNARLIAASPKMFDALMLLLETTLSDEQLDIIRSAIREAKGP